jgi:NAD+ diphosphatase
MFPKYHELINNGETNYQYLFSIDDERFFIPDVLSSHFIAAPNGYELIENNLFRTFEPAHIAFAVATALQLYQWYKHNVYCGCCGAKMTHAMTERACVCTQCEYKVFPKISPAVIVAVTYGEKLLVTRYKNRPVRRYALVAGFTEIGETLEDTVRREVFEETGVQVKNIKYYKSQPWGISSSLLSGYFCELDGDPEIVLDENELSEAIWLHRDEIPPAQSEISLTSEMMERFRTNRETWS